VAQDTLKRDLEERVVSLEATLEEIYTRESAFERFGELWFSTLDNKKAWEIFQKEYPKIAKDIRSEFFTKKTRSPESSKPPENQKP